MYQNNENKMNAMIETIIIMARELNFLYSVNEIWMMGEESIFEYFFYTKIKKKY